MLPKVPLKVLSKLLAKELPKVLVLKLLPSGR